MTSLSVSKISPNVLRPVSGVVGLVLTHPLTWCPQNPQIITFYSEKIAPLCGSLGPLQLAGHSVFLSLEFRMQRTHIGLCSAHEGHHEALQGSEARTSKLLGRKEEKNVFQMTRNRYPTQILSQSFGRAHQITRPRVSKKFRAA